MTLSTVGQLLVILNVAVVVFSFDPAALDSFALTKSVVSHITAAALLALIALVLMRDPGLFRLTPIHVAMLALVVAFVAATPFAIDRQVALFGGWRRYLGLDQMADHAVLFLGVATFFRTQADRDGESGPLVSRLDRPRRRSLHRESRHASDRHVRPAGYRRRVLRDGRLVWRGCRRVAVVARPAMAAGRRGRVGDRRLRDRGRDRYARRPRRRRRWPGRAARDVDPRSALP